METEKKLTKKRRNEEIIAQPILRKVVLELPTCPICGSALQTIENPDVRTMFTYECSNLWCNYVY
jgi:hypothetical protein